MRSVDERVAAVLRREKRLRKRRDGASLTIVAVITLLPFVGFAKITVSNTSAAPSPSGGGLFGASLLYGSNVGGYILVALASCAVAVLVTAFLMMRRQPHDDADATDRDGESHPTGLDVGVSGGSTPLNGEAFESDQADSRRIITKSAEESSTKPHLNR